MSAGWDDFEESSTKCKKSRASSSKLDDAKSEDIKSQDDGTGGCNWGQDTQVGEEELVSSNTESSKFIAVYERYLENKDSINKVKTKNCNLYSNNPQKALREWFENEGHEFLINTDQPQENEYICSIDIPIEEHDFTLTSEVHPKKQQAIDEICLAACSMLDECQLLNTWESNAKEDHDKKRRFQEANKEDDIELDNTKSKRLCPTSEGQGSTTGKVTTSTVNTYESLMARWSQLSMSILKLKAELVKLDLSVTKQPPPTTAKRAVCEKVQDKSSGDDGGGDDDSEVDPLDEYMSSLETKTKLSMDEKIEKSRIKAQISAYEREQENVSRLIELAKPKFDLNKACSRTSGNSNGSISSNSLELGRKR